MLLLNNYLYIRVLRDFGFFQKTKKRETSKDASPKTIIFWFFCCSKLAKFHTGAVENCSDLDKRRFLADRAGRPYQSFAVFPQLRVLPSSSGRRNNLLNHLHHPCTFLEFFLFPLDFPLFFRFEEFFFCPFDLP